MATGSLRPPQLVVQQNFATRPAGTQQTLQPFVYGGLADLIRYDVTTERSRGFLGQYDDSPAVVEGVAQSLYAWPDRPVGNIVDEDYVKLFIENGLFRYYQDLTQTAYRGNALNKIKSPTVQWQSATGAASNVIDGGVVPGDKVIIRGIDGSSEPFELASYVIGTEGLPIAASVASAVPASTNQGTLVADAVVTTDAGNTDNLSIAADESAYNGLLSDQLTETYTIEVIVAGAAGTARVKVTSLSGTDNQASVQTVALGSDLAIGTRGLVVVFTQDQATAFALGDKWTVAVTQAYTATTLATTGTYTGNRDRTYIVEVIEPGTASTGPIQVFVSSQDGTDTLSAQVTTGTFSLGSYGLTGTFTMPVGAVKGDKWTVVATAATTGKRDTLVIAHELPSDIATDDAAELEIDLFKTISMEIPHRSHVTGQYNYTAEPSQLRVRGDIQLTSNSYKLDSTPIVMPLQTVSGFSNTSRLYVQYRSWYPQSNDIFSVASETDLDDALLGPIDPDNPLKYAVSLARLGAVGETIHGFNVGDPKVVAGWSAALTAAGRSDACYGYVPLTQDPDILVLSQSAVNTANGETYNSYRVLWTSSAHVTGGAILSAATTDDEEVALAIVEDDSGATGTQYTQLRIVSGNADLSQLGVRVGDVIRYVYAVDAWGGETYISRTIAEVRSATTAVVSEAFPSEEAVPRRVEIHRTYLSGDLREHYSAEASQWASDLVRHVLAPVVTIGSYELPAYFLNAILSGMRAYYLPQQPLSTMQIPGVLRVGGLDALGEDDLNRLAAAGAFICNYDYRARAVRVRHAITTGDTDVLAKREESMVSARHAALFAINSRLENYAGTINLGDDEQFGVLEEQLRSELRSVAKELQVQGFTPELGGLISDLIINRIAPSVLQADELLIEGELVLRRPGNSIRFAVLIR